MLVKQLLKKKDYDIIHYNILPYCLALINFWNVSAMTDVCCLSCIYRCETVKNSNKLDELFNSIDWKDLMIADVPSDVVSGYCTL